MKNRSSLIFRTSVIGILVNLLLTVFKAVIGWFANSIAITLDAVNNLTDAVSSIITIIGIQLAGKDPDKKHPFGHGRTEYISTLAIAIIIIYAGVTAGIESIKNIIHPKTPDYNNLMLIIIVVAIIAKIFLSIYFQRKGKIANSDALIASGKDALSDVMISAATLIAAVVFMIFKISLEAYLGIIISAFIIKNGAEILGETISKIVGEGESVELVRSIKKTIVEHEGVNGAYDLIFNNYGQDITYASVHIEIDDSFSANDIDILSRHITEDIYNDYGIYLTAIGIYSHNTKDPEVIKMREKVEKIALSHEHVNQVHGFYVDRKRHVIRFDMVISFDEKSRADLYQHVMEHLKEEFPEYTISAGMDTDFNEI